MDDDSRFRHRFDPSRIGSAIEEFVDADDEVAEATVDLLEERLKELREVVNPARVAMASIVLLLMVVAGASSYYWVIPRESVGVETVYAQRGGHVIMVAIHNDGSRAIHDVELQVRFSDSDGVLLDALTVEFLELESHGVVWGDDLEMIIIGESVWETYEIELEMSWRNHRGEWRDVTWYHDVGEWTSEEFMDRYGGIGAQSSGLRLLWGCCRETTPSTPVARVAPCGPRSIRAAASVLRGDAMGTEHAGIGTAS